MLGNQTPLIHSGNLKPQSLDLAPRTLCIWPLFAATKYGYYLGTLILSMAYFIIISIPSHVSRATLPKYDILVRLSVAWPLSYFESCAHLGDKRDWGRFIA